MDYVFSTEGLTKQYKNCKALDRLNMHVEKGAIYGFVGKNGAGKTAACSTPQTAHIRFTARKAASVES